MNMIIASITRVTMGLHVIMKRQITLVLVHQSTWDHFVKLETIVTVRHVETGEHVKMEAVGTRVIVRHSIGEITVN